MATKKPEQTLSAALAPALVSLDSLASPFLLDLADQLEDGVYFVDQDHRIVFWNRAAERVTGFAREEVLGRRCGQEILRHVDHGGHPLCDEGCMLRQVLRYGRQGEADAYLRHKNGHRIPVKVRAIPIHDEAGHIVGAAEVFHDGSARIEHARRIEELERLAMIDELTRVPNRRHFDTHVHNRLAELRRHGWSFGLILIDVDDFKQFNDEHGHDLGDRMLKLVAKTLDANSRVFDTVARWGGEEFAALVVNVNEVELMLVAEKLRSLVAVSHLSMPDGQQLGVTISVGATVARPDDTPDSLFRRADEALYRAKHGGRNRVSA